MGDNIDLEACTAKGVVAMNTPGQNSNAVAELAFGMMLMCARNHYNGTSGFELRGKTLGIHGFGAIGRCMLRLAKGFEMNVLILSRSVPEEVVRELGAEPAASVADLFSWSNFVSLHVPATPLTKKSIGKDLLLSMPRKAALVNTARKEVIDEEGMKEAFRVRQDLKYLFDVGMCMAPEEVCGPGRFICTEKKMGAQTSEANENAGIAAARQIVDFFETGDVRFQVNKPLKDDLLQMETSTTATTTTTTTTSSTTPSTRRASTASGTTMSGISSSGYAEASKNPAELLKKPSSSSSEGDDFFQSVLAG